jgi:hypothetical protein
VRAECLFGILFVAGFVHHCKQFQNTMLVQSNGRRANRLLRMLQQLVFDNRLPEGTD